MASIDAEIIPSTTNHEESSTTSENEISTSSVINAEQTDSRVTDPDGAQSPASSTYADCEDQNDNSSSENQPLNSAKEKQDQVGNDVIVSSNSNDKKDDTAVDKVDDKVAHETEPNNKCEINNNSKCDDDESDLKNELDNTVDLTDDTNDEELPKKVLKSTVEDKYPDISENEDDVYAEGEDIDQYYDENDKSDLDEEFSDDGSDQQEKDRENGDGEEGNEEEIVVEKELDDDEDRRNPQYIPKRGFFYEHDDRTVVISEDETSEGAKKETEVKEQETKAKGKRFIPDGRWQHDMYREDEQKPKSSQELIDIYGYDIRHEEAAPKARRRRKYGRGPNKYTRKWDDEGAYAKQAAAKPFRGRNKTSFKKEDYDQEFPTLNEKNEKKTSNTDQRTKEPSSSKKQYHSEPPPKYEDGKYKDERIENQRSSSDHHDRPARNFSKRIPNFKERPNFTPEHYDSMEFKRLQKTIRNSNYVPNNDNVVRSRGRGVGHGKNIRMSNNYEESGRMQFTPTNRGRSKRLERPSQHFYPSKPQVPAEDIHVITEQISAIDIEPKKLSSINKLQYGDSENLPSNEQSDALLASSNVRSKRYSQQRQRLLPEMNKSNPATLALQHQNLQQNLQPITHSVQNIQNVAASGLCQSLPPTHTSLSLITQNQCAPAPQTVAAPLSVTPASISSNSLAVSASLIPLSAPPLTASGPALSAGAPPLPIMGFFQHPQGFTNQATPAQLYPREQTVMGAPSNQPVQLVAFLPASPILSNTNHSQSAPPPPPPPPPPGFPTTVMSYQQPSQAPQNTASFNSESYSMPPATLAPIHQPPEVYQSRGGVTYYNTRSQVKPRSPPPPRVKTAIPIVPPPSSESLK
ncbi:protein CASC3-like isoform X2 [Planococcus citri]|uniref:protein CASC3-like isoform X2 n=1 Tax=Planococcus citri TaxID=170843 RepID=UPI0031FA25F1